MGGGHPNYEPYDPAMHGSHSPWEGGLRERLDKEAKEKAAKEAEEAAAEVARQRRERETAAEAAATFAASVEGQTGVSIEAFVKQLNDADSTQARLELVKGRASQLFKAGFYELAEEMYTKAIGYDATHQAYSNRSACRCATRDYGGALVDADTCIQQAPDWGKGYARRGAAWYGLGHFGDAISAYEKGLQVEPGLKALQEGLADTIKRLRQAGGDWTTVGDGLRKVHTLHRAGEGPMQQLRDVGSLCLLPDGNVCVMDVRDDLGTRDLKAHIKPVNRPQIRVIGPYGAVIRTFNEQFKECDTGSLSEPTGIASDGTWMFVSEGAKNKVLRMPLVDMRALGSRKESPDKIAKERGPRDGLELSSPAGLAVADTSRMGGGGEPSTLYVCDSGNGRVLALDPKEFEVRFTVGRQGSGEGELGAPVSVAAHGDLLAVADATNHRVAIFTLRGTFLRSVGERPSKFSAGARAGQFVRPPAHVGMAAGHLFVIEQAGSRVHIFNPETGEPLGMIHPPFNLVRDGSGLGALTGLCVNEEGLYVASSDGPRVLCLSRRPPPSSGQADSSQVYKSAVDVS